MHARAGAETRTPPVFVSPLSACAKSGGFTMGSPKQMLVIALIALVAVAIASRVSFLKGVVFA